MRPLMLIASTLLAAPVLLAQSPAEQASRMLNLDIARDRARDAAQDAHAADTARAAPAPVASPTVRQLEADRATNRPDVGRPEESGRAAGSLRATGEDRNITR